MALQFITHITLAGQRWDSLAYLYYGDATYITPIIQANPQIPVEPVFEAGLVIGVPLLQVDSTIQNPNALPPWDR